MTPQAHKRFRAQYIGQEVLVTTNEIKREVDPDDLHVLRLANGSYLELKPLSMISDEDAIGVGNIILGSFGKLGPRSTNGITVSLDEESEIYIWWDGEILLHESLEDQSPLSLLHAYDFLRSKSYALPFDGHTIEQMIAAGWMKLKTNP